MAIQVSTRVDETTKKQFYQVCESIGISPSNALSMFIKGVINYNGIPFNTVMPAGKNINASNGVFNSFPETQASNPFPSLTENAKLCKVDKNDKGSILGCMKGSIWMSDDFDEPLEDFKEYM
jgi:addiction module RelB/DinJ family antitoxin